MLTAKQELAITANRGWKPTKPQQLSRRSYIQRPKRKEILLPQYGYIFIKGDIHDDKVSTFAK